MVNCEFQAVVLAGGRGSRFPDLIGDKPKCLLPVGPFPLVWYPLNLLQRHGFQDAIIVVLESQKSEIQQKLEKTPLKIKLEYCALSADMEDIGTADALRFISEKIKTDVLIISCDTIADVSLYSLFNVFRQNDASVAALFLKSGSESDAIVPGPKAKHKAERDLIGINPSTSRLVFLASTSDFDEEVTLPGHLLRRNGKIEMHSGLVDTHIYVIKKWVIEFLKNSQGLSTIKGELLPFIVKKQMSRPANSEQDKPLSEVNVNMKVDDIFDYVQDSELNRKILETSLFSPSNTISNTDLIRCYASVAEKNTFGLRVNTTLGYCAANQKIFSIWSNLLGESAPSLISPQCTIKSTQFDQCAVAENTTISEKTSIRNSILGSNCMIKPKVRITGSVIMNSVTVEEGVVIENCIICDKVVINSGSELKNCLIGANFVVQENTKKEKVNLTNSDGFMEIE